MTSRIGNPGRVRDEMLNTNNDEITPNNIRG
jgi:hypothetical protein